MKVSGCNDDMSDEASLCLGLVPIGSNLDVKQTHPMAECLPMAPIPNINQTNPPTNALPPSYDSVFTQNVPNLQICPPGPMNYPMSNIVDKNVHGSQNNIVGAFETHPPQNIQNPPMPGFQPYPYVHPGQNAPPYPGPPYPHMPQGQSPYPVSGYPNAQFPNLPPGQSFSAIPSAPPQ